MANLYDYVKSSGLIVPDTGTILTDVQNEFKAIFGDGLSLDPSTPQGRLIETIAKSRVQIVGLNALVANQINIDYSTGNYLDSLGSLFGINRIGATQTRVFATVSGRPGTVIPTGSIAQNDDKDNFVLENAITINTSGSSGAYFLSQKFGEIACPVNTLKKIITNVLGWETINNKSPAEIGRYQEVDFDYSIRIKRSRYSGIGLVGDIETYLNKTLGVKSFIIYNNPNPYSITFENIVILSHSILAVVDGGANIDVATSLYQSVSAGCDYTPITDQSVVVQVPSGYGFNYPITFNRPIIKEVVVDATIRKGFFAGTDEELINIVKEAITNWSLNGYQHFERLRIGKEVSSFEMASVVTNSIPSSIVKYMLIGFQGTPPSYTELNVNINEIAHIDINNITVTVEA